MQATLIDILTLVILSLVGLLLGIAQERMRKLNKTQEEQTKSFNAMSTSIIKTTTNYTNFKEVCTVALKSVDKRLEGHGKDIDILNITQKEQDVKLKEHHRRVDILETKI